MPWAIGLNCKLLGKKYSGYAAPKRALLPQGMLMSELH